MLGQLWITIRKMGEFRRNEKLSRAEFEAVKLKKFRKLVRYANERSSYYADIIKERGINLDSCVPEDFPVLTKSILMANFDRIVTDKRVSKQGIAEFLTRSTDAKDQLLGEFSVLHTSGSSGEVGYFVYSKNDWARGMANGPPSRDMQKRPPFKRKRKGKFNFAFYGAVGGHFAGVSMATSALRWPGRWFMNLRTFEINTPLPETLAGLNEFQPEFLVGYTTALKILAGKQQEGLLNISPLFINAGGEGMTPADKALLESAFKCEAVSGYGCTEHLMMGTSNADGVTMTLYDDDLIYEFFDDHSLISNLFNYTLPLIRYRMSDILRPIAQANPKSPHMVINSLVGRTEKVPMFTNRDGVEDFISPHTINEIFVAGVVRFQMRLIDKTRFQFAVILDSALNAKQRLEAVAATARRLREVLDQKQMSNVTFEVTPVDDLPLDVRTRKFRLIVDALAA
jgi:phenylacetate-coenzyme A ligase PaaK-like adenylate-forming protein